MLTTEISQPVSIGDRVTFDSDEGYQAGTVNDLRRDVGNGELHAWVELDHQWPGMYRAVPLDAIEAIKNAAVTLGSCGARTKTYVVDQPQRGYAK